MLRAPGLEHLDELESLGVGTVESNDCAKIEDGHQSQEKSGISRAEKHTNVAYKAMTRIEVGRTHSDKLR